MAQHHMSLTEAPFAHVKSGIKTIEVRLLDEKRKSIKIGDDITFSCGDERVTVAVIGLSRFARLIDLFTTLGCEPCGWVDGETPQQMVEYMRGHYSADEERALGVLGIHMISRT